MAELVNFVYGWSGIGMFFSFSISIYLRPEKRSCDLRANKRPKKIAWGMDRQTDRQTDGRTDGHRDSMTDPAQRAKSVRTTIGHQATIIAQPATTIGKPH